MSYKRAMEAQSSGKFSAEIVGVEVKGPKGEPTTVLEDEDVRKANFEKIPKLKPAFIPDGTITAANASKISDGAAIWDAVAFRQAVPLDQVPPRIDLAYSLQSRVWNGKEQLELVVEDWCATKG